MEIAQGYARRPKRIYAIEKCEFSHFAITLGYPFFTNFLQTIVMKKVHLFSYFVVLCWFLNDVSLKGKVCHKTFHIYCPENHQTIIHFGSKEKCVTKPCTFSSFPNNQDIIYFSQRKSVSRNLLHFLVSQIIKL